MNKLFAHLVDKNLGVWGYDESIMGGPPKGIGMGAMLTTPALPQEEHPPLQLVVPQPQPKLGLVGNCVRHPPQLAV